MTGPNDKPPLSYQGSFDDEIAPGEQSISTAYDTLNTAISTVTDAEEDRDIASQNYKGNSLG
jgi:hypothetical protein